MSEKAKKRRDAVATKEAILQAGKSIFMQQGYDGASLRDIAALADCNAALVNRYFGTKRALFAECVKGSFSFEPFFTLPKDQFVAALVDYMINLAPDDMRVAPTFTAVRSSTNEDAMLIMREELGNTLASTLADYMGGYNSEQRAALLVTQMLGLTFGRHMLKHAAIDQEHNETLRELLIKSFASLFDAK